MSKNKRLNRKCILSLSALAVLLCVGLAVALIWQFAIREATPPDDTLDFVTVSFYFRDAGGHWGQEARQIEMNDDSTAVIQAVLLGLQAGPRTTTFLPSIPEGVYILVAEFDADTSTLGINFSLAFNDILPIERTLATNSLVHTLTNLDFVDQLRFYVDGEPMLDGDGNLFGLRNPYNTALGDPVGLLVADTVDVILYFPNDQMTGLVGETRAIDTSPFGVIEHSILDALIEGPQTPDLYPIFASIAYNRVERVMDVITVDFAQDFWDRLTSGGSAAEEMMVFSLVNTMTARAGVRRVHILIDGQRPEDVSNLHMDLSRAIERDESLIVGYIGD